MAPTLRMTAPRVHVLAVGPFGEAVAGRLAEWWPVDVDSVHDRPDSSRWPEADVRLVAAWRPTPALFDQVDHLAHAWRVPWLPAVLEHPYLRVGPTVAPGIGPCHRCAVRRSRQHDPAPDVVSALHDRYDADPAMGPAGHLAHHTLLAAALVLRSVDGLLAEPAGEAGTVRRYHLLDGLASTERITGIHGCGRCGRGEDEQLRSWRHLADEVSDWRRQSALTGSTP